MLLIGKFLPSVEDRGTLKSPFAGNLGYDSDRVVK
jgi:hypothetical protein